MTLIDQLDIADIKAAAARIEGKAIKTPLIQNAALNRAAGTEVFVKPENLQRTGSFKFRGAYNRLSMLTEAERSAGVVAWSSGNHAQGIAAAAALLGIPSLIVMPADTPSIKMKRTREYGAEIVMYDRTRESREDIARGIAQDRGAVIVPSFDDYNIIAGQGTAGLEFIAQLEDVNKRLSKLFVCCGGGGLIAGMASAFAQGPNPPSIHSVEPAEFDDHVRSLETGSRQKNDPGSRSICDALLAPEPGELTFPINRNLLSAGLSVTDDEAKMAMQFAFEELKLVVEPGGAVALAAVLSHKIELGSEPIGIVLSGGNVDPEMMMSALSRS